MPAIHRAPPGLRRRRGSRPRARVGAWRRHHAEPTPFYGGVLIARFLDPWRNLWWVYQPLDSAAEGRAAASQATSGDTSWHNREPSYVYRSLMDGMELLRRELGR